MKVADRLVRVARQFSGPYGYRCTDERCASLCALQATDHFAACNLATAATTSLLTHWGARAVQELCAERAAELSDMHRTMVIEGLISSQTKK